MLPTDAAPPVDGLLALPAAGAGVGTATAGTDAGALSKLLLLLPPGCSAPASPACAARCGLGPPK